MMIYKMDTQTDLLGVAGIFWSSLNLSMEFLFCFCFCHSGMLKFLGGDQSKSFIIRGNLFYFSRSEIKFQTVQWNCLYQYHSRVYWVWKVQSLEVAALGNLPSVYHEDKRLEVVSFLRHCSNPFLWNWPRFSLSNFKIFMRGH